MTAILGKEHRPSAASGMQGFIGEDERVIIGDFIAKSVAEGMAGYGRHAAGFGGYGGGVRGEEEARVSVASVLIIVSGIVMDIHNHASIDEEAELIRHDLTAVKVKIIKVVGEEHALDVIITGAIVSGARGIEEFSV